MRTFLVGYDLNKPGQDYSDLIAALKKAGTWWHHLDSTWLVRADTTHTALRDRLKRLIDSGDELLVIDVTGDAAAWAGFSEQAGTWIKEHL